MSSVSTPASLRTDSPQPPGLPSKNRKTPRSTAAAMRIDMKPPTLSSSAVRAPYNELPTNFKGKDAKFALRASKSARTGNTLADLMEEVQKAQIAERIRELRKRSPLTQPQIADRMTNLTLRGYQKMEAVGTTKWERVQELAAIHNVDAEWIWTGEEEVAPSDRLARMETTLERVLELVEGLTMETIERDTEAEVRRAETSAERSAKPGRANGSQ